MWSSQPAIVPAYPPTIRVRGSLRFTLHDFAGALADAKTVLTALPDDATALALLGDASIELGRPADAVVAAYTRLAAASPGPWLDIRRARLFGDRGPIGALALARSAAAAAPAMDPAEKGLPSMPSVNTRAWREMPRRPEPASRRRCRSGPPMSPRSSAWLDRCGRWAP